MATSSYGRGSGRGAEVARLAIDKDFLDDYSRLPKPVQNSVRMAIEKFRRARPRRVGQGRPLGKAQDLQPAQWRLLRAAVPAGCR
jgi:hypothetical protein